MGQRSQIIVIDKDKEEGNRILGIWHNQWMYGVRFVKTTWELLYFWKKAKADLKKTGYDWQRTTHIHNLIKYVDVLDFPECKRYFNQNNKEKELSKCKTVQDVFKNLVDNNNGYIILYFDGNEIAYDIVSGTEDTDEEKRITAKEYLALFYPDDNALKESGFSLNEANQILKEIEKFKRINSFELELNRKKKVVK